jgi:hypothetical protein
MSDPIGDVLGPEWRSLAWRLDHLYWIIGKDGKPLQFRMNPEQRAFIERLWPRNIILKARQLGFSTLMQLLELDHAIFRRHANGVVIADTLPNAGRLFDKIEFAFARLPEGLKQLLPLKSETGMGYEFAHGSTVTVGVSARGGTVQLLHVSELGKTARKRPQVSAEIVSGAFESVPLEGCIVVESTAEGAAGDFFDLCAPAMKRWHEKAKETRLDWRLHFFPWFTSLDYRLTDEDTATVAISVDKARYFDKLQAELSITLDANQRAWYVKKEETLKRKMKQEYPSTPEEAFEVATEGAVYGEEMTFLREKGRLGVVPIVPDYPVNTFWDLGKRDKTAIWLHQMVGVQHRWVHYHEDANRDLNHYWTLLEAHRLEHGYRWGKHYLPHDAATEILGESITTHQRTLERLGMRNTVIVPRVAALAVGINQTRDALVGAHWFDKLACAQGIKCLDGYQYEWDDKLGVWSNEPLHNWASHGADAWRQFAQGWTAASAANDDEVSASIATFRNRHRGARR